MPRNLDLFQQLYRAIKHVEMPQEELEVVKSRLERINAMSSDQGRDPPDPPARLSKEES